jgi:hypothetical protein
MIEAGQFLELGISVLKEEGQPKLATLFAFGCEPVTICAVGTISPTGYTIIVSLRRGDLLSEVTSLREVRKPLSSKELHLFTDCRCSGPSPIWLRRLGSEAVRSFGAR